MSYGYISWASSKLSLHETCCEVALARPWYILFAIVFNVLRFHVYSCRIKMNCFLFPYTILVGDAAGRYPHCGVEAGVIEGEGARLLVSPALSLTIVKCPFYLPSAQGPSDASKYNTRDYIKTSKKCFSSRGTTTYVALQVVTAHGCSNLQYNLITVITS
jgi:hypothetical protein